MVDKSAFTPEEWQLISTSPMLAALAVSLADPSGLFGTLKEGAVGAKALLDAGRSAEGSSLAKLLSQDFSTSEGRSAASASLKAQLTAKNPAELKTQALAALGKVNAILTAKAGTDAPAFRTWLKGIARDAAEASKEGGFLGFGGVRVSDAEKATLSEIDAILV